MITTCFQRVPLRAAVVGTQEPHNDVRCRLRDSRLLRLFPGVRSSRGLDVQHLRDWHRRTPQQENREAGDLSTQPIFRFQFNSTLSIFISVLVQLAAALDYIHAHGLVHRDVKLDNILVFRSDFSRIKLCDFGETRKAGTSCTRRNEWLHYAPPEVLAVSNDKLYE